jgi:hypothetical protein
MSKGKDKNYVSFWFWMFALFVTALPCVGVVMVIVWAFVGENESRKNYYRAVIAWFLIFAVIWTVIMALGLWPAIQQQINTWIQPRTTH